MERSNYNKLYICSQSIRPLNESKFGSKYVCHTARNRYLYTVYKFKKIERENNIYRFLLIVYVCTRYIEHIKNLWQ